MARRHSRLRVGLAGEGRGEGGPADPEATAEPDGALGRWLRGHTRRLPDPLPVWKVVTILADELRSWGCRGGQTDGDRLSGARSGAAAAARVAGRGRERDGGPQPPRTREGCRRHRAPGRPSHALSARFTAPALVEAGARMSLIDPEPPEEPPSESSAATGPLHCWPRAQKPSRSARGARRARELRKDAGQGARPAGGVWYVGRKRAREGEETGRARRPLAGRQGEFSGKAARAAAGRGCRGGWVSCCSEVLCTCHTQILADNATYPRIMG